MIDIKTIKMMASVEFAKLLGIRVRIYSIVEEDSPPKKTFFEISTNKCVFCIFFKVKTR
jgi:hypothetical protein